MACTLTSDFDMLCHSLTADRGGERICRHLNALEVHDLWRFAHHHPHLVTCLNGPAPNA